MNLLLFYLFVLLFSSWESYREHLEAGTLTPTNQVLLPGAEFRRQATPARTGPTGCAAVFLYPQGLRYVLPSWVNI